MDCLFCKIATGGIASDVLYEDAHLIAFSDIKPQAPVHKLIIPKIHIATINDLTQDNAELVSKMFMCAKELATILNIADDGYRCVLNCNANGGQEVFHLHLHLLGGRRLTWPPG